MADSAGMADLGRTHKPAGGITAPSSLAEAAAASSGCPVTAAVLFADIRGFSAIAEALGPQATVRLLNEHFTRVAACVERHGGIVDKFIGDAALAVFLDDGAGEHAERAVRAAVVLMRATASWSRSRARAGLAPLPLAIGIDAGPVVAAAIGPPHRSTPTVIGDGVNTASRLERACRLHGAGILISGRTSVCLFGRYRLRRIDRPGTAVPGAAGGAIFEVLAGQVDAVPAPLRRAQP
jgi:class 3 adenylate cyclase